MNHNLEATVIIVAMLGTFWCRRKSWAWNRSVMATRCSVWGIHCRNRNSWATAVWYNL